MHPHHNRQSSLGQTASCSAVFDRMTCKTLSIFISRASAKAEGGLSSLSCVWMYVDQNQGTPLEMAYPLGIP